MQEFIQSLKNPLYLIIYIAITAIIIFIIVSFPNLGNSTSVIISATVGPLLAGIILRVIDPYIEQLSEILYGRKAGTIRILMFGASRVGKSTFIQTAINNNYKPDSLSSTSDFHVIKSKAYIGTNNQRKAYSVHLADYRGQYPSQFVTNPPANFFGRRNGKKRVNAIIFMTDLFPEITYMGEPLREESAVKERIQETYRDDTLNKIKDRVRRNKTYISEEWIQTLLSITTNPDYQDSLCVICLIINKIDLLKYIMSLGYLDEEGIEDIESFVANLYSVTIRMMEEFVNKTPGIDFFVYHAINSTSTSQDARKVYNEVINKVIECGRI